MIDPALAKSSTVRGRSGLADVWHQGRIGRADGTAGVTITEREGIASASIVAANGKGDALSTKIKIRTGLDLPKSPRIVLADHLSFTWTAPNQWLAMADGEDGPAFADDLAQDLAGLAAVSDQTDGRTILRISGPRVRDVLAKGCMLDLHDKVFRVGDTAVTPVALLNVQITRLGNVGGASQFELGIMRSFAPSFWHFLEASAAEFGIEVK